MRRLSILFMLSVFATPAWAQPPASGEPKPSMEIYGFAMLDVGQDFQQIDPDWFDTMRVTQLPSFEKQFGDDGRSFFSVRQTRFGVRGLGSFMLRVYG